MKEKFEEGLVKRIKEVQENHDIPYDQKNWLKLQEKRKRKKRRAVLWLYGRYTAAVLLLFLLGWPFRNLMVKSLESPVDKNIEIVDDGQDEKDKIQKKKNDHPLDVEKSIDSVKRTLTYEPANANEPPNKYDSGPEKENKIRPGIELDKQIADKGKSGRDTISKPSSIAFSEKDNQIDKLERQAKRTTGVFQDSISNPSLVASAKNHGKGEELGKQIKDLDHFNGDSIPNASLMVSSEKNVQNKGSLPTAIDSVMRKNLLMDKLDKEVTMGKRGINIGLAFSPLLESNQENGSTGVSLGGAVVLEIPISKKLDIYTGIQINNRTINFTENDVQTLSGETQLKSQDAQLTILDIPINLKYNFNMKQRNAYVAIGVSSVTNLQQDIVSTFQTTTTEFLETLNSEGILVLTEIEVNTLSEETVSRGGLNDFYFSRLINMSFGIEFPLENNRHSLTVEPYFKYALGSMTEKNLDLSGLGLSVRLNFKGTKNEKSQTP